MNREDMKTLLLILLFCVSIFFTKELWIEVPGELLSTFKRSEGVTSSYIFSDMIRPYKLLLNFNKNSHTLLYVDEDYNLWPSGKIILRQALSEKDFRTNHITDEEFLSYQNYKSITYFFSEEMSTYILAKALEVKAPNDITEKISKLNSIYIFLEKDKPILILSNNNEHIKFTGFKFNTKALREITNGIESKSNYTNYYSMKDTLGINNELFIPYKMTDGLPVVYVQNEIKIDDREEIRDIAERFFGRDIDYLREVVEDNGSTIYIYNQKVLKIHLNGYLEYFSPLEEPISERNLYISLNTAADFISNHSTVLKGMYVDKVENIESDNNLGYRLTFKYRTRGIPLVINNADVEPFIQIEVFNKYVRSYKRFVRKDMNLPQYKENLEEKKMLSAFDVINMNYDLIESRFVKDKGINGKEDIENLNEEVINSIEDISLAYFDPCTKESNEKLVGIWAMMVEGRVYGFDVYTGELVYENDLHKENVDGE